MIETMEYTPDYIEDLQPNQVFVFGSNILGYHTGGASKSARKLFGAVWGQAEGLQGQSYAIPVDYGKAPVHESAIRDSVNKFIQFAKDHPEFHFLVTRIGCGIAGFQDREMAQYFKETLTMSNVSLPKSFVEALEGKAEDYDLERFMEAQDEQWYSYDKALAEIKNGQKVGHWIWYVFPQMKGLGHSYNSEYYGISGLEEAKAYLADELLGSRLREISQTLLSHKGKSAQMILGSIDALKVRSSMTLFDLVSPNDIFADVLNTFYDGVKCDKTLWRLGRRKELKQNMVTLSKLVVTKDFRILLPDMGREITMEPLVKAVYVLFLKHPEGIAFKKLPDYKEELRNIYVQMKGGRLGIIAEKSIDDLTDPLNNSINEKCSRIRAVFLNAMNGSLASQYIITGKSGEKKGISLPQDLIVWE